jgi:hypothetical protein
MMVKQIIDTVKYKIGRQARVWVMDRGMAREENLTYLRERGGSRHRGDPQGPAAPV